MQTFRKLLFLLTSQERKRAGLLLSMIIVMAFLDMIGVASILPFMAVLTDPSLIETNLILNYMLQASTVFGVKNNQQFLFALGILVFILLIISLSFKALTTYVQVRFVQMREYSIGKRMIEGYLYQPYSWFLNRHSADLGKTILSEVSQIISNGIRPLMILIAQGIVTITLVALLVLVNPKLAIIVGFSLSIAYGVIFFFLKKYLNLLGKKRLTSNRSRFTAVSEAFNATKEIKIGGLEKKYIQLFSNSAKIFAETQSSSQVIAQLPRFILEVIAFGGILLMILFIMSQKGSFNSALPMLSLYIFAGYRLMPALQQIYVSITSLAFVGPSVDKIHAELKSLKPINDNHDQNILSLNKQITLKNIDYCYPNSSKTSLKDINLIIPAKSTVGIVGTTGSGKTTIIDIILSLLEPQKGTLEVDGKVITNQNSRSWQRSIGYVPQHIYLSDDTVSANIAFGVKLEKVNQNLVKKAAEIANLHDFVIDELPKQYQTIIGERGVRLSGGQRQRVGIARALYHNPEVLILDEATSALDNETEQVVMDAIKNINKDKTIILIAHRLKTIEYCDIVFKMHEGKIVGTDTN